MPRPIAEIQAIEVLTDAADRARRITPRTAPRPEPRPQATDARVEDRALLEFRTQW